MRRVLPLLILIAGCSAKPDDAGPPSGSFSGGGRDRLCIAHREGGVRAGIITYGAGDSNCSVTGTLARAGAGWQLTPQGEGACKIALSIDGAAVGVTSVAASCSYYCAPGATLTGKTFKRDATAGIVSDFGGEAIC